MWDEITAGGYARPSSVQALKGRTRRERKKFHGRGFDAGGPRYFRTSDVRSGDENAPPTLRRRGSESAARPDRTGPNSVVPQCFSVCFLFVVCAVRSGSVYEKYDSARSLDTV